MTFVAVVRRRRLTGCSRQWSVRSGSSRTRTRTSWPRKTFRGTAANGGPVATVADYLMASTGGFWTNKRMPATASTIARGIVYRMGQRGDPDRVPSDLGHDLH